MNKKLGKLFSVLVLMFPLLASLGAVTVNAAEVDKVSVNLHKRVFENGESQKNPYPKQNTGLIMEDFGGQPLNNVTFEAYDVSDKFLELVASGQTAEDATAAIVADAKNGAPDYGTKVGSQKTAGEGVATFEDLAIQKDGKYQTYLFVETNSPSNITEKAAPIVLTMPVYVGETNEVNTDIHVYPKNEKESLIEKDLSEETKKELGVTINGETVYTAGKGQEFEYGISAVIPWNIADKDYYRITDTPDEGMEVLKDTVKIKGLTIGDDYTIYTDASGRGYVVYFNTESEAVKALAGKRVEISYQARLTDDAKIDFGINNKAYVEVGTITNPEDKPKWPGQPVDPEDPEKPIYPEEPEKPETEDPDKPVDPKEPGTPEEPIEGPDVFTGGKKFLKVDEKSNEPLAGAKFNLVKVNAAGEIVEYATYKDGKYTWNADKSGATSYESNAEGKFEIKGLQYSEKLTDGLSYAVVEYEAPKGYALIEKPVTFEVVKDQFDTEVLSVKNIKKGLLPSTGGNGIYLFLVVGSVLMAGAGVWYRRTQVSAEV